MQCGIDSKVTNESNKGIAASNLINVGWSVKLPIMIGITEWLFCCSEACLKILYELKKIEYAVTPDLIQEAKEANLKFTEKIPIYAQNAVKAAEIIKNIFQKQSI
jgi:hypothetical protein